MVKIEIERPALLWYTARLNDDATSCAYSSRAEREERRGIFSANYMSDMDVGRS